MKFRQRTLAEVADKICGNAPADKQGAESAEIPSVIPPDPLIHLWLLPAVEVWEGLLWTRDEGWMVLAPRPRSVPSAISS
jgi:hypothetical protein